MTPIPTRPPRRDRLRNRPDDETVGSLLHLVLSSPRTEVHAAAPAAGAMESALAAVAECQARYRQAWETLADAQRGFQVVVAERDARLAELGRLVVGATAGVPPNDETPSGARPDTAPPFTEDHAAHPRTECAVPPALLITCFGRFAVRRGGEPVELCPSRNGQAILRYLIAQPRRRATIDTLVETFWPDEPPGVARHKLHCAFSALRRSLNGGYTDVRGGGYLLYQDGVYCLNPAVEIETDVEQFLDAVRLAGSTTGAEAAAHLERACRLYAGPFMAEDLYADWPALQRERLAQRFMSACSALADHALSAGRFDDAAGWAVRLLEEDRCDEEAYRVLIRAHAGAGRRAEALRHYQRCERTLAEELGIEPAPETSALLRTIVRGGTASPRRQGDVGVARGAEDER